VRLDRDTRVLITGASRGIGRACAEHFAERGCVLGVVARSGEELEGLAAQLRRTAASVHVLQADVADREQVREAVSRFARESGGLDVLVANAGIAHYGPFVELPLEEAERMTRVNWLGTVYCVAAALPHMLDRATGRIVIVSSGAGHRAFPWAAVYGGTKAAQRGFLEALHHELSGSGVGVTGVYPGQIKTHLHDEDRAHDRLPDWYRPNAAIPPQRVAQAIVQAVERDRSAVYVPPIVRLLRIVHGLSPALADRMLRAIMGRTAAPAAD
jgi:short-subunit dehydrogenase